MHPRIRQNILYGFNFSGGRFVQELWFDTCMSCTWLNVTRGWRVVHTHCQITNTGFSFFLTWQMQAELQSCCQAFAVWLEVPRWCNYSHTSTRSCQSVFVGVRYFMHSLNKDGQIFKWPYCWGKFTPHQSLNKKYGPQGPKAQVVAACFSTCPMPCSAPLTFVLVVCVFLYLQEGTSHSPIPCLAPRLKE